MSNYEKIYWLTRLDSMHIIFVASSILGGLCLLFFMIINTFALPSFHDGEDLIEVRKNIRWIPRLLIPVFVIGFLGSLFLPTKNDMILIYAGGKTMDYVQSDSSLSKIPYQTTSIISEYLDKQLNELKHEPRKEK